MLLRFRGEVARINARADTYCRSIALRSFLADTDITAIHIRDICKLAAGEFVHHAGFAAATLANHGDFA
jgi:hypothetical protein